MYFFIFVLVCIIGDQNSPIQCIIYLNQNFELNMIFSKNISSRIDMSMYSYIYMYMYNKYLDIAK